MSWSGFLARFQEGDAVRFNKGFLAQTKNPAYAEAKGKIASIEDQGGMRYAKVEWDREGLPDLVNVANLAVAKERSR